jgi:hypothetical protein
MVELLAVVRAAKICPSTSEASGTRPPLQSATG